jgi:hypothetical protein
VFFFFVSLSFIWSLDINYLWLSKNKIGNNILSIIIKIKIYYWHIAERHRQSIKFNIFKVKKKKFVNLLIFLFNFIKKISTWCNFIAFLLASWFWCLLGKRFFFCQVLIKFIWMVLWHSLSTCFCRVVKKKKIFRYILKISFF